MRLNYPNSTTGCQVEIHVESDSGFRYWLDMTEIPPKYHFSFGGMNTPRISSELSNQILQALPPISKFIFPPYIPIQAAEFISTAISMNRDIHIEGNVEMTVKDLKTNVHDGTITQTEEIAITEMGVDDGFREIVLDDEPSAEKDSTIEHRELWVADKQRMDRLSYRSIAAVRGDKTFPEELGGGRI